MTRNANFDLADAILKDDLGCINEILDEHPELIDSVLSHPHTTDDTPAIILAASCGAHDTVRRLIQLGADTETKYDKEGWRPLHIAAQRNHIDVAKVLLESGAIVEAEDNRKAKPIQWALKHKHFEFAELLLAYGADINVRWRDGYSFLHHEAKDGRNDTLRFMLQHGADPNTTDQRYGTGSTPLHGAARNDRQHAAQILIEFGADVNTRNDNGLTPLDMTRMSNKGMVSELLKHNDGRYGTEQSDPVER